MTMTRTYRPLTPAELKERGNEVPGFGERPPRVLPFFVTEDDGTGRMVERFGWGRAELVRELLREKL